MNRKTFLRVALMAAVLAVSLPSHADNFPSKPIRFVVPFAPGGASDVLARLVGQHMGQSMKQSIVVDNKLGAGGSIATAEVARSAPDGYTILMATSSTHGINPAIYKKLPYDAVKDFAPITTLTLSDYALVVPATSPYKTIQELIAGNKRKQLSYASNGTGTTSHLASALLGIRAGTEFMHIPYKASTPAMTDLMGGQVDFLIDNTSTAQQNLPTGKLRILATTGKQRGESSKNIPTMLESGVPDYEVVGWWAFLAPAGTPKAVVDRLHDEFAKAVEVPEVKARMVSMGYPPLIKTPAETASFISSEMDKFKRIAQAINLQLD